MIDLVLTKVNVKAHERVLRGKVERDGAFFDGEGGGKGNPCEETRRRAKGQSWGYQERGTQGKIEAERSTHRDAKTEVSGASNLDNSLVAQCDGAKPLDPRR